ncbi:MAG: glycosyltransferase family 2 protein [Hyphomicrobium sp.]
MKEQSVLASATKRPAEAAAATVAVVVVNYCTPDLTIDCIKSLQGERARHPGLMVHVADNASPDGSARKIAQAIESAGWSDWVQLAALPKNGGFGYGNNAIIRQRLGAPDAPHYFWLLNSDTIVRPGALAALVSHLERRPEAGMAGSRLEDPDGTLQCSAFRFHSILGEFEASIGLGIVSRLLRNWAVSPPLNNEPSRFDWLSGASLLVRADTFRSVGLMDERYFLYYEETDFCLRARSAGWACWYVPDSRVVHLVGQSTGITDRSAQTKRRAAYWFESRRHYFVTHHGRLYAVVADMMLAVGTTLGRLRDIVLSRQSTYPQNFLSDLLRHSAVLKPALTGPNERAKPSFNAKV